MVMDRDGRAAADVLLVTCTPVSATMVPTFPITATGGTR